MSLELPRLDPLPAFNFYITLLDVSSVSSTLISGVSGFVMGGFSECSGLEARLEIEEDTSGAVIHRAYRFPTRSVFSNITLKRGVGFGEDLWLWHEEFLRGEGTRRNGLIVLANELQVPIKIWSFERGIPVKWTGPAFSASSSQVAVESIEIAHEKLELMISPGKLLDRVMDMAF